MKGGTQAAVAIGVGYMLGRRRKMRRAALLAAAAASGGVGGLGSAALRRGAKMIGSTEMLGKVAPQVGELADTVRGDLLDAGKAAARAAVTGRIESLTDSLHDRAAAIRDPGAAAAAAGDTVKGATKGATRRGRRAARLDDGDDPEVEEETEAEYADEPEDDELADDELEDDEPEDDAAEDDAAEADEPEPRPRRRTSRSKSPVARTRR